MATPYAGEEESTEIRQIVTDLESYLVRRSVCMLTTKNYNRFFLELVDHLQSIGSFDSSAIRNFLLSADKDSNLWPTDDMFRTAWLEKPL
jgi:hypothetical protein